MAKGLVDEQYLTAIANAIRTKSGTETQYKPSEMANAINSIPTEATPGYVSFYKYRGTSLDISWLDVSNITNMENMFGYCSNITTVDVSNWDTSNVTDMNSMFVDCRNLTTLDVSSWNTSNVTDMNSMFSSCNKLITVDVSNWNTSNVTDMGSMFSGCGKLTTLDISNWDTGNVTRSDYMFYGCGESLETPTTVFVKDAAMQQWVLNTSNVPASWSTANVIIKA